MRWIGVLAVLAAGCVARDAVPAADEDDSAGMVGTETGDAEASEESGYVPPEICPCETIDADWTFCDTDELTTAVDAPREPARIAEIPEGGGSLVAHGGELFTIVYPAEHDEARQVHRWQPDTDAFELVVELSAADRVVSTAPSERGLLLLLHRDNATDRLMAWTPEAGLESVATFGDSSVELYNGTKRVALRAHGGRAVFGFEVPEPSQQRPPDSDGAVEVDLLDGTYSVLEEPLTGVVPTDEGYVALQAQVGEYQFCADYSCLVEPVTEAWDLVDGSGPLATGQCVETDQWGVPVDHAWQHTSGYVFVNRAAARRIGPDGREDTLWRGEERVADALVDGDVLFLGVSREVEGGDPGAGRQGIIRVSLVDGAAERILDEPIDDDRISPRLGMVREGQLLFSVLRGQGWRLEALEL